MSAEYNVFGQIYKPKNKFQSVCLSILFILFFAGVIYSFIVLGIYSNDNKDYRHTHDECKTYATVSNVAYDEGSRLIYVFYEDAHAVNVYDISGDFQWSVSIPKQMNGVTQFYLDDGRMFLIWYKTYIYDAKSGDFIDKHESTDAEIDKACDFENNNSLDGTGIDFDLIDVYITDNDGAVKSYIVNRPDYYALINPFAGWLVSFTSGVTIASMAIFRALNHTKKLSVDKEKCGNLAKCFSVWYKFLTAVCMTYAIANIVLPIISSIVILHIIVPIGILFIVSGWIYAVVYRRFNSDEKNAVRLWFIRCFIAIGIAFISTIVSVVAFG